MEFLNHTTPLSALGHPKFCCFFFFWEHLSWDFFMAGDTKWQNCAGALCRGGCCPWLMESSACSPGPQHREHPNTRRHQVPASPREAQPGSPAEP